MKQVKTLYGQTPLDIAIQELGDASRVMELAEINDISPTEELTSGTVLTVPDFERAVRSTVQLFTDKANAPASADISGEVEQRKEGIGYWIIGKDFKVS